MSETPTQKIDTIEQLDAALMTPEFGMSLAKHLISIGQIPDPKMTDEELLAYFQEKFKKDN